MTKFLTHSADLPCGYRVTFTYSGLGMDVNWSPELPCIHSPRMQRRFDAAYFQARDDFLQTVATMMRGAVAVADMQGNVRVIVPEVVQ
ncbi:hypothetical protein [Phyllobacterium lublinensis]|uniref:hypothetical protein n=1 Tax=Phyllobacterium lublinensis TaxID=2875708 RepID=UPI001CCE33E4|nr:hypothetical protein [Phyllobacterium sp. 2063]MBZ9654030.1 hypothetical protein [Phyllobacterium sp. 2063]